MAYRQTDRTRRRAEEKQVAFLGAALDLVALHGFAGAKVSAIAQACHASTGSLYSYFDSREDLLAAVFREVADRELTAVGRAVAEAPASPTERLDALIRTFTRRALRGRRMAWSLLFEPVAPAVEAERLVYRRAYVELGEGIIRDGITEGAFAPQNATVASSAVIGAISEALVGRLGPIEPDAVSGMSDELLVAEIRDFCFRALGRPSATPS
ncbi:TetR/AcrR family transcriptional regulator [Streptomyces sp. DT24]|uniref:TetR/AcrR family transcriptional regulator n=1 Tax=unclassified Streptomyces TaxID=2593676 RepID=UPI0023B9D7F1|nr:TetR/AcrR family transcriptional regulator [Streptomyces sp. AM 4-1-1]WEH32226.1 TetR/AcrR family transcriptional regulator [Streptomyces sp. AM 4-1-1]